MAGEPLPAPELHLRPDQLRAHAATAAVLVDDLSAAGDRLATSDPETDRLRTAVRRTAGELTELRDALVAAAACAERGDCAAAWSLGLLLRS